MLWKSNDKKEGVGGLIGQSKSFGGASKIAWNTYNHFCSLEGSARAFMLRTFNSPSGHVGSVTKVIKINLGQIYWMNFAAHSNRFVEPDKSYVVSEDVILEKINLILLFVESKANRMQMSCISNKLIHAETDICRIKGVFINDVTQRLCVSLT